MSPHIDTQNTFYLRNVHNQQHVHVSGSGVVTGGKVEDLFHQWKFIPAGSTSDDYFIQSVGNDQYLGLDGRRIVQLNGYHVVSTSTTPRSWRVSWHSTAFKIEAISSPNHNIVNPGHYIVNPANGYIYAATSGFTLNSCYQQPNSFMWHLDPVSNLLPPIVNKNPLPNGNYRIRSFIGSYVLMTPKGENGRPYVRKQVQDNNAQEWSVQPQLNGLYTIRNTGTQLYLAGPASNPVEGAPLIGQSAAFGDIRITLPNYPLAIGFPNYEAENLSEVTLQATDSTPSQIWFFEISKSLAPATFHTERLLEPGTYILQSCQNHHYLAISPSSDLHLVSGSHEATQFALTYAADHTSTFTLGDQDPDVELFLRVDRDRVMASDQKTDWVVLPSQHDGGTVYIICEATGTIPRRVLSSQKKIVRRKEYFLLDPLAEHEVQMWKFNPVRQMHASDDL